MLEETGCDAVMLGRAAFGDPWVFRRVRSWHESGERLPQPTAGERLDAGLRHLLLMVASAGSEIAAREMRKHVAWYLKGLPRSARVREQVNRTGTAEALMELLCEYRAELERDGLEAFAEAPAGAAMAAGDVSLAATPATPDDTVASAETAGAHAAG
jgi:tRNA-dihydrouridine synthase